MSLGACDCACICSCGELVRPAQENHVKKLHVSDNSYAPTWVRKTKLEITETDGKNKHSNDTTRAHVCTNLSSTIFTIRKFKIKTIN